MPAFSAAGTKTFRGSLSENLKVSDKTAVPVAAWIALYFLEASSMPHSNANASALLVLSHVKSGSSLPKWPVCGGFLVYRTQKIQFLHNPCRRQPEMFSLSLPLFFPQALYSFQKQSTFTDVGLSCLLRMLIWTSHLSASPAATTFFATHLAAYAPERSTLDGSLPEKQPPPCLPTPP